MGPLSIIILALVASALEASNPSVKIHGGEIASPTQFPFIVSLNRLGQFCSGSIINKKWVLTAAYCILEIGTLTTLFAGNRTNYSGTAYRISKAVHHPDFNTSHHLNDIGLIQIDGEFEFGDFIQPIEFTEPGANATCYVAGWGETASEPFPADLRFIEVTALGIDDCKRIAGDYAKDRDLGAKQICALGAEGQGACYGDAGGPLVCGGKLAGIVSYALFPCAKGIPDVYVRPSKYADWIINVILNS